MADQFSIYDRDMQTVAFDDTLDVFRRAPVLRGIQQTQMAQVQELYSAEIDSLRARTLDNAAGENLNVIGRIVGLWPRPLIDAGNIIYFTPDTPLGATDLAPMFVTNAPQAGLVAIGDVDYKKAIRAKIIKNQTKYGSAPEIMNYGQFAYDLPVSVHTLGLSDLEVVLSSLTPPAVVAAILGEVNDDTADHQFNMPLPTTSRIKLVSFRFPDAFAPDLDNGAPDVALMGVGYGVN